MAVSRKIIALSPKSAAELADVKRRTLGRGNDRRASSAPPSRTLDAMSLWCEVYTSSAADAAKGIWNYGIRLYTSVASTHSISGAIGGAGGVDASGARNTYERSNTNTQRSGYTVSPTSTTCGDVTGTLAVPPGVRLKVVGYEEIDGQWRYLFSYRNDPVVRRS